jgi:hypothetical protein
MSAALRRRKEVMTNMYDDPLEEQLAREAAKYGISYQAIVRQAFERAAQRRKRRQRFPLDPFVLLERLLRSGLRGLERLVAQFVRAVERRLQR